MAAVALSELVWGAIDDVRSPEQTEADAQIDAECRDEPDALERLRQDAIAVCGEYFSQVAQRGNHAEGACPGCEVRAFARCDLVAEAMESIQTRALRSQKRSRRTRLRVLSAERQMELAIA